MCRLVNACLAFACTARDKIVAHVKDPVSTFPWEKAQRSVAWKRIENAFRLLVMIRRGRAADAEIKVSSVENAELKGKAWSRSVYSHTRYAYCQGLLSC